MKVRDVMSAHVSSVSSEASFRQLWHQIFKLHVNALPVVDKQKKLIGIVSREDILKYLYPNYQEFIEEFSTTTDFKRMEERVHDLLTLTARDLMCKKVIYTRTDTPIMRALSRMIIRRLNQLPVLSENNRVIGMVTKGDIFYALFKRHLKQKETSKSKPTKRAKTAKPRP